MRTPDDLMPLIDLRSLHFHNVVNGEIPYIGFLFGCKWDQEHGLGVLMHGLRPVKVGSADTAILEWIAQKDAENTGVPSGEA